MIETILIITMQLLGVIQVVHYFNPDNNLKKIVVEFIIAAVPVIAFNIYLIKKGDLDWFTL